MFISHGETNRSGSVYIAVLGTSLIISVLAMSALALQRIQNRMLLKSADVQQAQLNAESAIELGLLEIQQDANWRTTHNSDSRWFTNLSVGAGTCSLDVIDSVDDDLDDDPNDPIVMIGLGYSGTAEQRVEVSVDPRKEPLACLRAAVAAGDAISVTNSTLRTSNSVLVSANSVSASSAMVYGSVEAVNITGSTYAGTTSTIDAAELPEMPDWSTVFDYYIANGTEIDVNNLPTSTPNLGRNVGIENGTTDWTGTPPGVPSADISQSNNFRRSGTYSLRVQNRSEWYSGAAQRIDHFVKPGRQYYVEAWVYIDIGTVSVAKNFHISLYTKGTGSTAQFVTGSSTTVLVGALNVGWTRVAATLTAPSWSGDLEYAFVKVGGADSNNKVDFYVDDLDIRDVTTSGRFIYRRVLGPGINPFGPTNAQGIYWIDCGGNRLIIERSRIKGTLVVINPGSGSRIGDGPIHWSPAVPGYPALMVRADDTTSADFTIEATDRTLSETENGVKYNPPGAPHEQFGEDADLGDIYPSEILGLVVVADDVVFGNNATIRGQVIAGGDITVSGGTLEVDFQPDSLLNPPPGFTAPATYVRPGSVRKTVLP